MIRGRSWTVVVTAATAAVAVLAPVHAAPPAPSPPAATDAGVPSDPVLAERVADAASAETPVAVELRTTDSAAVTAEVDAAGGTVTGEVPGALIQATVPAGAIEALRATPSIDDIRAPRRVERLHQFGPSTTGAEAIVNASAWHAAGFTGAGIKVGVIDLFAMSRWNTAENGPVPTVDNGHLFCRDTSGYSPSYCVGAALNPTTGSTHGLAVVEQIKDLAPDAEIFIATIGTTADLAAAVDFFAGQGVRVINRSMGAALDGPGDGTGPLAEVVDLATRRGITWFNSAGNDARNQYARTTVDPGLGPGMAVPINGDPLLRINGATVLFDGIRWNDWYRQRTDYSVELWVPKKGTEVTADNVNPPLSDLDLAQTIDRRQVDGDIPLEAEDVSFRPPGGVTYLRIVRNAATPVGPQGDILEIAVSPGATLEAGAATAAYTAARPVVDSRNPGLIAVGAVDPPTGTTVAGYSSRGPTNDGRIKPDLVAPSGLPSASFAGAFSGTSAAAPEVAGAAALLLQAGLAAAPGELGGLIRSMAVDIAGPGPDNDSGAGMLRLPAPPAARPADGPAQFVSLSPARILDTRDPAYGTPYVRSPSAVVNVPVLGHGGVPTSGVSAVALNVTVVNSTQPGFVQVLPTLDAQIGATSTQNLEIPGVPRPALVITRLGADGSVSAFLLGGGDVVVDVLGYYVPAPTPTVRGGRLVGLDPERWTDSRDPQRLPAGLTTVRRLGAGETVRIVRPATSAVPPAGIRALVVNLTADRPLAPGFFSAGPTGGFVPDATSNVNYLSEPTSNLAIVPVGGDGTISVFTLSAADLIVDVVGYITDDSAPASGAGLLVPLSPQRLLDTRVDDRPYGAAESRRYRWVAPGVTVVPGNATALSLNLAVTEPRAAGFLAAYPGATLPATANLSYVRVTNANASLLQVGSDGTVGTYMLTGGQVIVDINGYFTGP